jgi:hypothetical protein
MTWPENGAAVTLVFTLVAGGGVGESDRKRGCMNASVGCGSGELGRANEGCVDVVDDKVEDGVPGLELEE